MCRTGTVHVQRVHTGPRRHVVCSAHTAFREPGDDGYDPRRFEQRKKHRDQVARLHAMWAASVHTVRVDDVVQVMVQKWGTVRQVDTYEYEGAMAVVVRGVGDRHELSLLCDKLNATRRGPLFLDKLRRLPCGPSMRSHTMVLHECETGERECEWDLED